MTHCLDKDMLPCRTGLYPLLCRNVQQELDRTYASPDSEDTDYVDVATTFEVCESCNLATTCHATQQVNSEETVGGHWKENSVFWDSETCIVSKERPLHSTPRKSVTRSQLHSHL